MRTSNVWAARSKAAQEALQELLVAFEPYVEEASDLWWKPSMGLFPVVLRTVLRRQFDALETIVELVSLNRGFVAAPLLRPACEELIWTKYLLSIDTQDAETLVMCMGHKDSLRTLRAQRQRAGKDAFRELGLRSFLRQAEKRDSAVAGRMRDLHRRLDWPSDGGGILPSVKWIANQVDETITYDFLYHATSKLVHFSVPELLRRAWATSDGRVSVRSDHMRDYWSYFAMYWGFMLLLDTAILVEDSVTVGGDAAIDSDSFVSCAKRIRELGMPPIVIPEELDWSDDVL